MSTRPRPARAAPVNGGRRDLFGTLETWLSQKPLDNKGDFKNIGGEGGIRTHGTVLGFANGKRPRVRMGKERRRSRRQEPNHTHRAGVAVLCSSRLRRVHCLGVSSPVVGFRRAG